jgi:hypothetical protein
MLKIASMTGIVGGLEQARTNSDVFVSHDENKEEDVGQSG